MEIANFCVTSVAPAPCAWNASKLTRCGTLKNPFQISRHLRAVTKRCYRHLPSSLGIRAQAPDDENGTSVELQSDVERVVEAEPSKLRYGLITGLATAGLVETTYLTWMKLYGGPVSCPLGGTGCDDALNSEYGTTC